MLETNNDGNDAFKDANNNKMKQEKKRFNKKRTGLSSNRNRIVVGHKIMIMMMIKGKQNWMDKCEVNAQTEENGDKFITMKMISQLILNYIEYRKKRRQILLKYHQQWN